MEGWTRRHSRYLEGCRLVAHTIAQVNSSKRLPPAHAWMPLMTDEKKKREPTKEEVAAAVAALKAAKETGKLRPVKIVD